MSEHDRRRLASSFDPITLEVLWNRLIAIVDEQAHTLMRTAFSGIITDSGDLSAGVFDQKANMVAQAVTGTPGHINTMAMGVKRFVEEYPIDTLQPGDVLIGNNAYELSGHLNDITLVTPVFHLDRVVALFANCCHVADIGGRGLGTQAHDLYEEGLHIPYTKLYAAGQPDRTLMRVIEKNVRAPEFFFGDLHAMVVCNDTGVARLMELLAEFNLPDIEDLSREILDRTEAAIRSAIQTVPEGVYEKQMTTDGYDDPLTIRCQVTVKGDDVHIDFSGSSPQSRWGINVPLGYITAYATYILKALIGPDIPNNEGSFRPVRITAPLGSIFNPRFPAPVASRSINGHLAATCVLGAFTKALPELVLAEGAASLFNLVFRGETRDGKVFSVNFMNGGGMGARALLDGLSATAFPSGIRGTPVEVIESTTPLFIKQKELRPDSAGAGRSRGGLGQIVRLTVDSDKSSHFLARFDQAQYPPRGVLGGGSALPTAVRTGEGQILHTKAHHISPPGEEIVVEMPGGGGYGNPLERDVEKVLRDVLGGYVSLENARELYGVVIDLKRRMVDASATEVLRGSHVIVRGPMLG